MRRDQPLWPARSELEMSKLKEPWKQCGSIIMPLFKVNVILQGRRLRLRSIDSLTWGHGGNEWWNSNQTNENGGISQEVVDQRQEWWRNSNRTVCTSGVLTRHHHCVNCYLWIFSSYMQHLCKVSCRLCTFFFFCNLVMQNLTLTLSCLSFEVGQWSLCCKSWECQLRSGKEYLKMIASGAQTI